MTTYLGLAIAVGAAWLLIFAGCASLARVPRVRVPDRGWAVQRPPGGSPPDSRPEHPALVNLVLTKCKLTVAACTATVLDLAARGYLVITEREPGSVWCELPRSRASAQGLASFEQQALSDVSARLEGMDAAPFEAIAEAWSVDAQGRWDPFEKSVRTEARRLGLTRSRVPATARAILEAGAVAVAVLTFLAVHSRFHGGLATPIIAGFFAYITPRFWLGGLARKDRLTAAGTALGARARQEAADVASALQAGDLSLAAVPLDRRALAVAAEVPAAVPGFLVISRRTAAREVKSGRPEDAGNPGTAWSSFTGEWRQVQIGDEGAAQLGPGLWLALAVWLALLTFAASLLPGLWGILLPLALLAGAVAAAVRGIRRLSRRLALPKVAEFDGQVIARWITEDSERYDQYIAIDDGSRAWTFDALKVFHRATLGDLVHVRVAARAGTLLDMLVTGRPGADATTGPPEATTGRPGTSATTITADPPATIPGRPGTSATTADPPLAAQAPLLTADEISGIVGRPVRTSARTTPTGDAVIYRGSGLTVSLTVADGALANLTCRQARRLGDPLPGAGDEAWLLAWDRTAIVRVGTMAAKVTVSGRAPRGRRRDTISELAAVIATRLTSQRGTGP